MGDTERVRNSAKVLVAISIGAFLATFNETFLNVALTPIMQDYGVTSGDVQWVSTAYMLVAAVTVPVTSFLYRSIPTKRLSIIALGLLLVGTLVGAASQSFPMLIAARCIQALGTGMIVPIGMNLTLLVAPQGKLGTYMGIVSAVTLVGPASGPIVGGFMLAVASWHVLFLAFAALTVVAIIVNLLFVGNFEKLTHPKLDVVSVALICVGLIGVMYAISTAFSNQAVAAGSFVVGAVCLGAFIARQRKIENPLLDLRPFADKGFVCGVVVVFIAFMAVFAMNILLPLFMQNKMGFSALDAALTLLVPCMSCVVFAPLAGKLYDRYGFKYTLPAALLVMAGFLFVIGHLGEAATAVLIAAVYLPILCGCNFSIGPSQSFALDRLTEELHPHGVTVCYTAIQVAGCIGSSFYVGIMSGVQQQALSAGTALGDAVTAGFTASCTVASILALVGFCFAVATAVFSVRKPASHAAAPADQIISQVMFSDVYAIPSSASAYDALLFMSEHHTSGLPVVNGDGSVAGFVSDGDIIRAIADESEDKLDMAYVYSEWKRSGSLKQSLERLKNVAVLDVSTTKVVSVELEQGIERVCRVLSAHNIKKVPVTENGKIIGVVGRSNLLRYLIGEGVQAS